MVREKKTLEQRFQSRRCVVNARAGNFSSKETNLGDFICVLILMCARVSMDALITVIFIRMFCCCFHRRAGRRKRKRKAENGVWKFASRQPPTFIDLGTRSERIYHPSEQEKVRIFALHRIKEKKTFFTLCKNIFLSFPFSPTEFYCFRYKLSQVVAVFFSQIRLSYILGKKLSTVGDFTGTSMEASEGFSTNFWACTRRYRGNL